eukprot:TRINITY_DN726_c0_g3_i1.p1 TRINITY_DN726_c0_g3~~TRINITY_DN726_c0_g3_i1.p1  ORF type:complete len:105 (-),score=13.52 TRINITY_DN726_c0_g3_i1:185-499(-)
MSSRPVLLPLLLVAAAFTVLLCSPGFVNGRASSSSTSLRARTARGALPVDQLVEASSVTTALQVTNYGMAANIVFLTVPVIFLVTLYLQSERNKARIASGELEI